MILFHSVSPFEIGIISLNAKNIVKKEKKLDSGLWEVKFIIFNQHFVLLKFKNYLVNFFQIKRNLLS